MYIFNEQKVLALANVRFSSSKNLIEARLEKQGVWFNKKNWSLVLEYSI